MSHVSHGSEIFLTKGANVRTFPKDLPFRWGESRDDVGVVAYEVFRAGYYGTLVPNTALAKDSGGVHLDQGYVNDVCLTPRFNQCIFYEEELTRE